MGRLPKCESSAEVDRPQAGRYNIFEITLFTPDSSNSRRPLQRKKFMVPHSAKERADPEPETTLVIPPGSLAHLAICRRNTPGR